jgi:hypothetical protein
MRFLMRLLNIGALLAATTVGGCSFSGPAGNPDHQPYATDPGGAIAVRPQFISTEHYDPYGTPPPFEDMQYGSVAITPAPTPPLNLSPQGQMPAPMTMPRRPR